MNVKTTKIVQALQCELASANATKVTAQMDLNAEDVFYAPRARIRSLEDQISEAIMARRAGYRCPNTAALVAANID